MYLFKKNQSSVVRTFSSSWLSSQASFSFRISISSISLSTIVVVAFKMVSPLCVNVITVSRLSIAEVDRFTSFFNSNLSMILGTFEFFSIILQAMSRTHICSGYFPFRMRSTLYCSCVKPNSFISLLITVFSHQAVYSIFSPALCTSFLNFVLCMACSSFTIQMYVCTWNYPKKLFQIKKSKIKSQKHTVFDSQFLTFYF